MNFNKSYLRKLFLLIAKRGKAAFSVAFFFVLAACHTQHERLHQLMKEGKIDDNEAYDTLCFLDSVFPVVEVKANDRRQRFLIDPALPCLHGDIADAEIAVCLTDARGDTLAQRFGRMPDLQIGGRICADVGGGLLTESARRKLLQHGIHGVIGANLMQHNVWHFDFAARRVIIAPQSDIFTRLPQTVIFPFTRTIFRSPKWQVKFNRFPYRLVTRLSTGYGGGILLDKEFSDNYKSFMYDRTLQTLSFPDAIHGIAEAGGLLMDSLEMEATRTFGLIPVMRSQSSYALLGLAFFRSYRLTLDWRKRTVLLHFVAH